MLAKAGSKVRIHDTHAAFSFQALLISRAQCLTQLVNISAFTTAEPVIHKWLRGIVIRQCGVDALEVNLVKHEIPHISDILPANVSPKVIRGREMPFEHVPTSEACSSVIPELGSNPA